MDITTVQQQRQMAHEEREDPLMRLVYAIGILLTMFGHFIPGQVNWNIVGIALVVISGLANFLYLPYYPLWSIIVIAVDVFIIWALMTAPARRNVT